MGKVKLIADQDLKEIAEWLIHNVGAEACNRNLPMGHRRGEGWHLHIDYVGLSEWYTASVTIDDPDKMLLFALSHKCL